MFLKAEKALINCVSVGTNKLASLEATLVRNSADLINDLITHRGKV